MNLDFNISEFLIGLGIMMIAFIPLGGFAIYCLKNGDDLFIIKEKEEPTS